MTRVLLLATDERLTQLVESLGHQIASLDRERVNRLARRDGLNSLLGANVADVPEIVILGDGIPVSEALSMAQSIDASFPHVDVVLVGEPDTDLVLRAMRAGIRDIVPPSVSQDELKVLLHRAGGSARHRLTSHVAEIVPEVVDHRRIIVIAGAKGGVGRSTIASNIAVALAKNAPMETVLVDLDLQFGDAGILLDLNPIYSIADAFKSAAALDSLILKTILTAHPSGFYVLCGASSPTMVDKVTPEKIKHLLQQLSSQFRYVVVDTSAGLDEFTLSAVEEASDLVLVSSMDVASTRATRREIDVLTELDVTPPSRHVVLNFADRHSGIGVRDVEAVIGLPVNVVVPRSHEVPIAGNLGEALMTSKRGSTVAKAIRQLVDLIHEDEALDMINKHKGVHSY